MTSRTLAPWAEEVDDPMRQPGKSAFKTAVTDGLGMGLFGDGSQQADGEAAPLPQMGSTSPSTQAGPPEIGSDDWYREQDKKYPNGWGYTQGGGVTGAEPPKAAPKTPAAPSSYRPVAYPTTQGFGNMNQLMAQQAYTGMNELLKGSPYARLQTLLSGLTQGGRFNLDALIRQLGG